MIFFKLRSSIQSLIPLLYTRLGSAQAAVDQATEVLIKHVARFEEAAGQLLAGSGTSEIDGNHQLHDFVKGCRFYCSGNLVWRYGRPLPRGKFANFNLAFPCVLADFAPSQSQDTAVRHRLRGYEPWAWGLFGMIISGP